MPPHRLLVLGTKTAIAGSIAEAYWGVPTDLAEKAETYLEPEMLQVLRNFRKRFSSVCANTACTLYYRDMQEWLQASTTS